MQTRNSDREHREYIASLIRGECDPGNGVFKLVGDQRITRVGSCPVEQYPGRRPTRAQRQTGAMIETTA